MKSLTISFGIALLCFSRLSLANDTEYLVFEPPQALKQDKHIVFVSGDEEYRSEEWAPMLAKILSQSHGFKTSVLFAMDKTRDIINPNETSNIPGLAALDTADLLVLGTRWRTLSGEQLQPILDYLNAAKPVVAIRTATHAFNNDDHYGGYDWQNFGLNVIGENWLNHHGEHKVQGGRAVVEQIHRQHPILNAAADIFTQSDIYGIEHLDQQQATVLLRGAVTESLARDSKALHDEKNNPMMPLAWLKSYPTPDGAAMGTVFATTAGAAVDFAEPALRRLVVNASYYLLGKKVPERADVTPVDRYEPSFYGFQKPDYFVTRGMKVDDFSLGRSGRSILTKEALASAAQAPLTPINLRLKSNDSVTLIGNGLAERMLHYGYFESELYARHPKQNIRVRNLARPGMTPVFRPHASRDSQWAFSGGETLRPEFSHHSGAGHYATPDQWLSELESDVVLAFFGFNESFAGKAGVEAYKKELAAFVDHTLTQRYNGKSAPRLVLVSPIAFQDLSYDHNLPDGTSTNANLALYMQAMKTVAEQKGVEFVDVFTDTLRWFTTGTEQLTVNGAQLNQQGYRRFGRLLNNLLFGESSQESASSRNLVDVVNEKNFYWLNHYQMPNGVHVHGRRFEPYGPDNYPDELLKSRQLTDNREAEIWARLNNKPFDRASADAATVALRAVITNSPQSAESPYLYGQEALDRFTMADGYKIELFASEREFANLANPVQVTFDGKGRLWVAVMPSYPHYKVGDPRPNDKILIYEDTDNDGKADKETIFADQLHLPVGFELTPEGVYVSQAPNLVLLRDTDGDDRADTRDIILSGFDTHDTHHAISAFTRDPFGSLILAEGVFLHSNIETAYGPVRAVNGGFYRFEPKTQKLERLVQTHIPNPWGIAFDRWGQDFFLSTSNPDMHWMLPVEINTHYGELTVGTESLVQESQRVRPTSGLVFISSEHFPSEVQGDYLLNNSIGFLGAKQHSISDSGAGYSSQFRVDLYQSSDPNFRPVDMDFAPDGSLYVVDWHNQLIGHMQHNARDPLRDHAHGRIYRVSYPGRALVEAKDLTQLDTDALWQRLNSDDLHLRSRVRRELRKLPAAELQASKARWLQSLSSNGDDTESLQLEALWVSLSEHPQDLQLARQLLQAKSYQVRAAAVRAVRYNLPEFDDAQALLLAAASDKHPRVRLEAVIAASWLKGDKALDIVVAAARLPVDQWARQAYVQVAKYLGGSVTLPEQASQEDTLKISPELQARWQEGKEIYRREGYCATCHQLDGKGLPAAQFPPLAGTEWVTGNAERLIDIALHGLIGPITVKGQDYAGHVPMTQFKNLLDDNDMAAVLTYVRNAFGNSAPAISAKQVARVRAATRQQSGFWHSSELEEKYPD
ncbi:PVC-type heme-binding CxxCH protein [Gilvimarinus agarilyticus]|uniref:PVC-type heme-binding CxxCH protein n=1 Tax=Gilvimarinus agarilyticus TaxID=679259 RepID=UPI0005A19783|nr:PVC-type heme-binding CxxCH protein [Gilvimarinus agarilyticus]